MLTELDIIILKTLYSNGNPLTISEIIRQHGWEKSGKPTPEGIRGELGKLSNPERRWRLVERCETKKARHDSYRPTEAERLRGLPRGRPPQRWQLNMKHPLFLLRHSLADLQNLARRWGAELVREPPIDYFTKQPDPTAKERQVEEAARDMLSQEDKIVHFVADLIEFPKEDLETLKLLTPIQEVRMVGGTAVLRPPVGRD